MKNKINTTSDKPFKQADILWNRNGIESTSIYPVRVLVNRDSGYTGDLFLFKNRDLAEAFCYGLRVSERDHKKWNHEILDYSEEIIQAENAQVN